MCLPIKIIGLDHVVLRCVNLDSTLAFYRDTLGCTLERSLDQLGLYQLRAGNSLIDLVPVGSELGGKSPPLRERFNLAHFCVRVEGVAWEEIQDHLSRHGVTWTEPQRRYGADGFGESIYLEDPEGNTVELKGPPQA